MTSIAQTTGRPRRISKQNRAKRRFVFITLTPLMLYMLFWTLFPMIWAVRWPSSTIARDTGGPLLGFGGENAFVGLQNFSNMFSDTMEAQKFRLSLRNTLTFAFLYLPLNLAITIPLAVAIEAIGNRLRTTFRFMYFLPTVTASVGVALIWGYLYHPQQGLINMVVKALGGTGQIWLGDPRVSVLGVPLAMISLLFTYVWWDMGYNLIIFIAALQSIPREFKEAAQVDGANTWHMFWRITLPLLRPTLLFVCVLTMISSFQVFDIIQIMTQGGPMDQTRVLVLDIYLNAFRFGQMGWAGAESLVLFALIFIVTIIQTRVLRSRWEY